MLTVLFCVMGIGVLLLITWDWDDKEGRTIVAGILLAILVCFGLVFPFLYGESQTDIQSGVSLDVKQDGGKYYYLSGGKWIDVLESDIQHHQSDNLSVVMKKAPPSVWYWSISKIDAYIPIVESK